jgi:hypothetical protein
MLQGSDVREVFEAVLPESALASMVEETGFQKRERKLDAVGFLRAMIIAAASGQGGRQAAVARLYFENAPERMVRGAFYRWFGRALARVMKRVSRLALAYVASLEVDLPGWLSKYGRDWHIVDSSTVKLDGRLMHLYRGTGKYAALKIHKRFSVGIGTTIDYHISPARHHDARHLVLDESWRGLGLLVDLGYASLRLLRDAERFDVHYVLRLKDGWKPKVDDLHSGALTRTFCKGTDLDLLLDAEVLRLDGTAIDADVTVGTGTAAAYCRMVGVEHDGMYRFYLTNLPREVRPEQIVDLYRVRWEIESDNKLDKSCLQLDRIGARTGPAVRALVHASMVGSILVNLLAHHHRRREGHAPRPGTERTKAPVHPQALGRMMAQCSMSIVAIMQMPASAEADERWQWLAETLYHQGQDPNWRRSPSILDQLRGWRTTPGTPRKSRAASVKHPAPRNASKSRRIVAK